MNSEFVYLPAFELLLAFNLNIHLVIFIKLSIRIVVYGLPLCYPCHNISIIQF